MSWHRTTDKRVDDRHPGTGLILRTKNWDTPVLDVSVGGLRFMRPPVEFEKNEKIDFELFGVGSSNEGFPGIGFVRAFNGDWVAIQFRMVRYSMMRLILDHVRKYVIKHGG